MSGYLSLQVTHCGSKTQEVVEGRDANSGLFSLLHCILVITDMHLSSGIKGLHWGSQEVKKKLSSVCYSIGSISLLKESTLIILMPGGKAHWSLSQQEET